jgi:ribosomal protein L37E
MVRSVTVFDEDFTEDDMAAALDWQTEQANTCRGCGFPLDETTRIGADDAYDAEIVACHACAAGDRTERSYREDKGDMAGARRRIYETD